ncbi:MAG TPA: hypothetical protein VND15_03180 [Candidatus Acidoferrales bacterium]|nr:hypothetical protein [Candidatus Acidoferrales bacterium]
MHIRHIKHNRRIERLRGWFDRVAYISLIADIAIAIVTLIYVNTSAANLLNLQLILNYVLTIIVVISLAILGSMGALHIYMRLSSTKGGSRLW